MPKFLCIQDTTFNPSGKKPEWDGKNWISYDEYFREGEIIEHPEHPGNENAWVEVDPNTSVTPKNLKWSRNVRDGLVVD